jgi:segregation and condensation protein B
MTEPATQETPDTQAVADEVAADTIEAARARGQALRMLEALLFAAAEPLDEKTLALRLPKGTDIPALIDELEAHYTNRGVNLVRVAGKFAMRTASDLAGALALETTVQRKLSRAAVETLAIIAYHQPVTRAEVEEIRGVALSKGTLDMLMEIGWIKPKGHRETPGRPATWVTTEAFLMHFGLDALDDLPGVEELKAAGLLDARPAVSAYSEDGGLPAPAETPDEDVAAETERNGDEPSGSGPVSAAPIEASPEHVNGHAAE